MASVAIDIGGSLLKTMLYAKEMWDQRKDNKEVAEELTHFIKDLQVNLKALEAKQLTNNNTSTWSMAALKEDLEKANQNAQNILKMEFIKKLWDSKKIKEELRILRERVMTSFQVKLLFTTLDVTLDNSKNQKEFLAAMSRVQQELNRTQAETSAENLKKIKNVIRRELQQMWQPVQTEMQAKGQSVEGAIGVIKGTGFEAQTDDTEKFFNDVLMQLENAMGGSSRPTPPSTSGEGSGGSNTKTKPGGIKWYHDPITWDIMCDPVKGSDGRTYDRWTLLNNSSSMKRSPFDPGEEQPLKVEFDDIDVRSRLLQKFPEQEEKQDAPPVLVLADSPAPCRLPSYYFEFLVKDAGRIGKITIGFTTGSQQPFCCNTLAGWEKNSAAYRSDGHVLGGGRRIGSNPGFTDGDTVGAGIFYGTDEIFFRKNGVFLGSLSRRLSDIEGGLLYPTIGLCWPTKCVRVNLGETPFMPEVLPSELECPAQPPRPGRGPLAAIGCDFYFELQVTSSLQDNGLAIGFTNLERFRDDKQPGVYAGSCGYHQDGSLYCGGRHLSEHDAFGAGDTVGAGVLRGRNTIYFTRNGKRIASVDYPSVFSSLQVYPTVGTLDKEAFRIHFFDDVASVASRFPQGIPSPRPFPARPRRRGPGWLLRRFL